DITVDLEPAAPGIDQIGAAQRAVALELAQQQEVQDALGGAGMRQQADEDLGAREEVVEAVCAMERLDPGEGFLRAAPSRHLEAEPAEQVGGIAAEHAEPHDA